MNRAQRLKGHLHQIVRARVTTPPALLAIIVLVAAALFVLMIPAIPVGTTEDDGTYITMAQSLAQGKGLSLTYLPTDPLYPFVPIGYPLLLAPLVVLFPGSFLPLQLLSSGLLLVTVVLVYRYARPRLGDGAALLAAALFGTNLAIAHIAAQVMSEALFLLCLLGALLQAERFVRLQSVRWHHVLLTAALIGLPLSVRYLGSPIVAALILYILWQRRDRWALSTFVLGVVILLVINLGLGGFEVGQYYVGYFSRLVSRLNSLPVQASESGAMSSGVANAGLLARVAHNARFILTYPLPGILVPLFHGPRIRAFFEHIRLGFVPDAMQLGIDLLLAMGFIQQLRRKARAGEWVILAYAATVFLLPVEDWRETGSSYRYWIPWIPFGYMYLLAALQSIHRLVHKVHLPRWGSHPNGLALLGASCMLVLNLGRDVQESLVNPLRDRVPDLAVGSEWIQAHSDLNDVIMVYKPRIFTLYLQREVVPYPHPYEAVESRVIYADLPEWQRDPLAVATLCRIVDEFEVAYVLISPARVPDQPLHWTGYVQTELLPAIQSRPDVFTLVWASDDRFTQVYQVQHTATGGDGERTGTGDP